MRSLAFAGFLLLIWTAQVQGDSLSFTEDEIHFTTSKDLQSTTSRTTNPVITENNALSSPDSLNINEITRDNNELNITGQSTAGQVTNEYVSSTPDPLITDQVTNENASSIPVSLNVDQVTNENVSSTPDPLTTDKVVKEDMSSRHLLGSPNTNQTAAKNNVSDITGYSEIPSTQSTSAFADLSYQTETNLVPTYTSEKQMNTTDAAEATSKSEQTTVTSERTSESIRTTNQPPIGEKSAPPDNNNTIQESPAGLTLPIVLSVVAAAVVVMVVMCFVMLYTHRDRLCVRPISEDKTPEEPNLDCDHELYSTVNVYTNYRHHGVQTDSTLPSQEQRLMTKMELEDDGQADNGLDLMEQLDSGRYVSPEGLVYVSVAHTVGKSGNKKKTSKKKKQDKKSNYATLDFDKMGKLILKTDDNKSKKEKKNKKKKRDI